MSRPLLGATVTAALATLSLLSTISALPSCGGEDPSPAPAADTGLDEVLADAAPEAAETEPPWDGGPRPAPWVTGLADPGALAVDEKGVVFTDGRRHGVFALPPSGGTPTRLFDTQCQYNGSLMMDGGGVVFSCANGLFMRGPRAGGVAVPFAYTASNGVAMDASKVYLAVTTSVGYELRAIDRNAPALDPDAGRPDGGSVDTVVGGLPRMMFVRALRDGYVYGFFRGNSTTSGEARNDGNVTRASTTDARQTVVAGSIRGVSDLVLVGSTVYFSSWHATEGGVFKVVPGGAAERVATLGGANRIDSDGKSLFVATVDENAVVTIVKLSMDGATQEVLATGETMAGWFAHDSTYLYWLHRGPAYQNAGGIMRVPL